MLRTKWTLFACIVALCTAPVFSAGKQTVTFVEDLEDGLRDGGWTFGAGFSETIPTDGGNPGAYIRNSFVDSFAAQPHTLTGFRRTIFHGDYRSRNVSLLGIDLALFSIDFSAQQRPLSLILSSGDCKIFTIGGPPTPMPNGKWKRYRFRVPSGRATMPLKWSILDCPGRSDDEAWNEVITDVLEVRYFTGNPTDFFIFQVWDIGMDNMSLTQALNPPPLN